MKEIRITPPEGYEIDQENSTFECVKFKPIKKKLTYDDVAKELFGNFQAWYTTDYGQILSLKRGVSKEHCSEANICTSEKQAQKLLAINKLMNVAKYLNGAWKPDWNNQRERKYYLILTAGNVISYDSRGPLNQNVVYFRTDKLLEQAIEILGKDTIKLALSTDW